MGGGAQCHLTVYTLCASTTFSIAPLMRCACRLCIIIVHRFFKILTLYILRERYFPPNSALNYCKLGDKARALPKRSVYLSVPLKLYTLIFYNNTQYTKKRPIIVGRGKLIWWRILYALNLARSIPSCLKTIMPLHPAMKAGK